MSYKIKLTKEKRDYMISAIQEFFLKQREEELGELAAALILDFFIDKMAKEFYNQGVFDSYRFMTDKVEDLLGIQK
ncbi:MAG: DUF2164 domain-containing protein [Carboxydocellales bacterium]